MCVMIDSIACVTLHSVFTPHCSMHLSELDYLCLTGDVIGHSLRYQLVCEQMTRSDQDNPGWVLEILS